MRSFILGNSSLSLWLWNSFESHTYPIGWHARRVPWINMYTDEIHDLITRMEVVRYDAMFIMCFAVSLFVIVFTMVYLKFTRGEIRGLKYFGCVSNFICIFVVWWEWDWRGSRRNVKNGVKYVCKVSKTECLRRGFV